MYVMYHTLLLLLTVNVDVRANKRALYTSSVLLLQNAALVGGNHVLDVDECVGSSATLQQLQRLLDEVSHVLVEPLMVVDAVAGVHCRKMPIRLD